MCVAGCHAAIVERFGRERLGRRRLLGAAAAFGAASTVAVPRAPARAQAVQGFGRVVDLTHVMPEDFPTFGGGPGLGIESVYRIAEHGYNLNIWHLDEHTGTHMDAPIHFSTDGRTVDQIPVEHLVVPLAVIDIAARAEDDADAQLTPDDIRAWIDAHGPVPDGACVAMHSGWDRFVTGERFRNADAEGVMHFPGFHPEAVQLLLEETSAIGIAVDTLSLDFGASTTFDAHYAWLPANRWGLECVANLAEMPASGATLIVGAPKIQGATGGPSRVLALV